MGNLVKSWTVKKSTTMFIQKRNNKHEIYWKKCGTEE